MSVYPYPALYRAAVDTSQLYDRRCGSSTDGVYREKENAEVGPSEQGR